VYFDIKKIRSKIMGKKVFIVSSTMRKGGNSEILADQFEKGALEGGNEVKRINLRDINLKFCVGCLYCQSHDRCVLNDDINGLLSDVQSSDVLVFATPIYYYEMSGQLKTFLDRMNPLYPRMNEFKEVYLLATAADGELSATDGAVKGIQGWIDCFDGVQFKGIVFGGNAEAKGDVNNSDAPKRAYEMGKKL
jgi:NAD(P)H-dependent FMN reductase